jgi:AcrR family transcriptional regulator
VASEQHQDGETAVSAKPEKRQAGRPRSEKARMATLQAAMRLLEDNSVRELTIEAIAQEAGVGKVTIYRWWPNKLRLIIDAFLEIMTPTTSMPRAGTKLSDLIDHFLAVAEEYRGKRGQIATQIVAEGQFDRDTLDYFLDAVISRRREFAKDAVIKAQKAGEIRSDMDADVLIDLLYGPLYFRLLIRHAPIDESFLASLTQSVAELAKAAPRTGA